MNAAEELPETTPEINPEEQKAMQNGWVPQEQWEGDPNKWTDAKTFNEKGELLSFIKKQNKEISEMKKAITALGETNRRVAEVERSKALEELKTLRKEAIRNQDIDTADELGEKIQDLKQLDKVEKEQVNEEAPEISPVFEMWVENNEWYLKNKVLQGAANAIAEELIATDPNAQDQGYLLRTVEKRIKEEFPAKFNASKNKVADAGNSTGNDNRGGASSKLSPEERAIGNTLVQYGAFKDINEYAKSLSKIRG
jgi:hypothetical protein